MLCARDRRVSEREAQRNRQEREGGMQLQINVIIQDINSKTKRGKERKKRREEHYRKRKKSMKKERNKESKRKDSMKEIKEKQLRC